MTSLVSVIEGLKEFFDEELVMKVNGIGKWIIGAGLSMFMENAAQTFNELKENPLIKSLNIIDNEDRIDIEKLYSALREQANKMGAVSFHVPMIGTMTIRTEDLDHIYADIKKH